MVSCSHKTLFLTLKCSPFWSSFLGKKEKPCTAKRKEGCPRSSRLPAFPSLFEKKRSPISPEEVVGRGEGPREARKSFPCSSGDVIPFDRDGDKSPWRPSQKNSKSRWKTTGLGTTLGRACSRACRERKVRSKIGWLAGSRDSHHVSRFAAFFILARAEISVDGSCFGVFSFRSFVLKKDATKTPEGVFLALSLLSPFKKKNKLHKGINLLHKKLFQRGVLSGVYRGRTLLSFFFPS